MTYTQEWYALTLEDRNAILNFSNTQLAQLSLLFPPNDDPGISPLSIRACVAVALGISGIKGLITNTKNLLTASTAIELLTTIGKRYLNYIGIAWMVWDFADCISQQVIGKVKDVDATIRPIPLPKSVEGISAIH